MMMCNDLVFIQTLSLFFDQNNIITVRPLYHYLHLQFASLQRRRRISQNIFPLMSYLFSATIGRMIHNNQLAYHYCTCVHNAKSTNNFL